jgi:hypothetical protein
MLSVFAIVVKWEINIVIAKIRRIILSKFKNNLDATANFVTIIAS